VRAIVSRTKRTVPNRCVASYPAHVSDVARSDAPVPRCPECGAAVPCGARLGRERCWCMDHPPLEPDPALPADACLCEACLRRRLAARETERP